MAIQDNSGAPDDKLRVYWQQRVRVAPGILDALIADHKDRLRRASIQRMAQNEGDMDVGIGASFGNAMPARHVQGRDQAYRTIHRLGRGLRLPATDTARLFSDDGYISGDIRDVLLNPDSKAQEYPNRYVYSCCHFLQALRQVLDDQFWAQRPETAEVRGRIFVLGDFSYQTYQEDITGLRFLYQLQYLENVMPALARMLAEQNFGNWATIAENFGRKTAVMAADFPARMEQEIAAQSPAAQSRAYFSPEPGPVRTA